MRAGNLRSLLALERRSTAKNDIGQPVDQWTEVCELRAQVHDLNGSEKYTQSGEHSSVTTRIATLYSPALASSTNSDRFRDKYTGLIYDIERKTNPYQRNRELEFMCRLVTG